MRKISFPAVRSLCLLSILCALCGCTQDAYDKGEGRYSLMRGDFVEAHVNGQKQIDSITTDDGETLPLSVNISAKWVTTADTVYRSILYYNKVENDRGSLVAEPMSIGQVACPAVKSAAELDMPLKTDPVKFESAWMSKTGKYLNLRFSLMTGTADDEEAVQRLAVVADTVVSHPDATRTCRLRLCHDQGGVPEFYSTLTFASILMSGIDADSVSISIPTYGGDVVRTFPTIR